MTLTVTRTRTGGADVRDDGFQEANVVRSGVRGVGKCPATFLVKPRQKQALEVQYYLNIQSSPSRSARVHTVEFQLSSIRKRANSHGVCTKGGFCAIS